MRTGPSLRHEVPLASRMRVLTCCSRLKVAAKARRHRGTDDIAMLLAEEPASESTGLNLA
jgi:hypothetical protein